LIKTFTKPVKIKALPSARITPPIHALFIPGTSPAVKMITSYALPPRPKTLLLQKHRSKKLLNWKMHVRTIQTALHAATIFPNRRITIEAVAETRIEVVLVEATVATGIEVLLWGCCSVSCVSEVE